MWQTFQCVADQSLIVLLTENNVCIVLNVAVGWHYFEISSVRHRRPSVKRRSFSYRYFIFNHLWHLLQTLRPTMILLSQYILTWKTVPFFEMYWSEPPNITYSEHQFYWNLCISNTVDIFRQMVCILRTYSYHHTNCNCICITVLYFTGDFRFMWPCIINVGEERTNEWHK